MFLNQHPLVLKSMAGRGRPGILKWCYMEQDKFSLSWIKAREKYDSKHRSNLLKEQYKKDKSFFNKIIDLGSGNGSFLRYCHNKKIVFEEMLLIDYNSKLLRDFYASTYNYLNGTNYNILKESPTKYQLKKTDTIKTKNIQLINTDILKSLDIINNYNLISLSAMSDILPILFIKKLLNKVGKNKIIYFSICFDGSIKWDSSHKYDKYVLTMFNKHQEMNKSSGYVVGSKSIKLIKEYSAKKKYSFQIKDSSWELKSYDENAKYFQKMYLDTIYKPLKKDDITDKDMLSEWRKVKLKDIVSGKSKITVGHKDILILT
jgi:hypothetical protein